MRKLFKIFKIQKGFTLIELLVVIGVLGILASGLLATIDPLEQFRKGADSNRKQTSLELIAALTRYYSSHNTFPWRPTAEGGPATPCNAGNNPASSQVSTATGTTAFNDCLTVLTTEGELKTTFQTQYSILNSLYVTDNTVGTARSAIVCFDPDSKSESSKPETKYTRAGVDDSARCNAAPKPTDCYWCAQ